MPESTRIQALDLWKKWDCTFYIRPEAPFYVRSVYRESELKCVAWDTIAAFNMIEEYDFVSIYGRCVVFLCLHRSKISTGSRVGVEQQSEELKRILKEEQHSGSS